MGIDTYVLIGREPMPCKNMDEWNSFMSEKDARRVKLTKITDTIEVSTVFLGLDRRFGSKGPPILFETMVFDKNPESENYHGGSMWRTCTWDEAEEQHERVCDMIRYGKDEYGSRKEWGSVTRSVTAKKGTTFTDDDAKLVYDVANEIAAKNDGKILLTELAEHPKLSSFFDGVKDKKLRAFGLMSMLHVQDHSDEDEGYQDIGSGEFDY